MHNLDKTKAMYFIGIKGVGMSSLAVVAREMGIKVHGSDVAEDFVTKDVLDKHRISSDVGFSKKQISSFLERYKKKEALVVVTGAHKGLANAQAIWAREQNFTVMTHASALGLFMGKSQGISVAGTHGKTTTSAMISHILTKAGKDPSFAVGSGVIKSLGTSAHAGRGEWFVAEADEYAADCVHDKQPRFMFQHPTIAVITSIEYDHPDVYESLKSVKDAFIAFSKNVKRKGVIIAGVDDRNVRSILPKLGGHALRFGGHVITYGTCSDADYRISGMRIGGNIQNFILSYKGRRVGKFTILVPGVFNVQNSAAAIAACHEAGLSFNEIQSVLDSYKGAKRRFEFIGEKNGISLYDDYAHHPTEIASTLKAAKKWFKGNNVAVIFQAHTYSRTKALLNEFSTCFEHADAVGITPIYPSAREKQDAAISGELLACEISKNHNNVYYNDRIENLVSRMRLSLIHGGILFTMGAGDINNLHGKILEIL